MIEWLWAGLLTLAAVHRSSRGLAALLALKWAANYAAFLLVAQKVPPFIDIAIGTLGVIWATRHWTRWADIVCAGFVVTPLIHAWYWIQHDAGGGDPLAYYLLIAAVFTVQAAALTWPTVHDAARALIRRLDGYGWGCVAALAGQRRQGEGARVSAGAPLRDHRIA